MAAQETADAASQAAFDKATAMDVMPLGARLGLFVGTLAMSGSAYLLMFFSSECFEDFALTDQIDDVRGPSPPPSRPPRSYRPASRAQTPAVAHTRPRWGPHLLCTGC